MRQSTRRAPRQAFANIEIDFVWRYQRTTMVTLPQRMWAWHTSGRVMSLISFYRPNRFVSPGVMSLQNRGYRHFLMGRLARWCLKVGNSLAVGAFQSQFMMAKTQQTVRASMLLLGRVARLGNQQLLVEGQRMTVPSRPLPVGFEALAPELQEKILTEGQELGRRITAYTLQILIGPKGKDNVGQRINHGSGVQLMLDGHRYFATAAHVVSKYLTRRENEEVVAQIGNAIVPIEQRVAWLDDQLDLAMIGLQDSESQLLPSLCWVPPTWPPAAPAEGEYVGFSGFPTEFREDTGPTSVVLNAIGGILRVESASEQRLTSVMDRENLVVIKGAAVPRNGAELGGMSGGPVFRIVDRDIELVAVIKEDSQLFDAYFFAPFTNVHVTPGHYIAV